MGGTPECRNEFRFPIVLVLVLVLVVDSSALSPWTSRIEDENEDEDD
jgi:hypothetical protein